MPTETVDARAARPPLPAPEGSPWTFRTATPSGADVDLVHRWMNEPGVARFWDQAWSRTAWSAELSGQLGSPGRIGPAAGVDPARPCIVTRDDRPVAYLELYWCTRHAIARHYPARRHDVGVHIAVGDPAARGSGCGTAVLRDVVRGMVAAVPGCSRVLAEPDAANTAALRAFARAGFDALGEIELPHKRAVLVAAGTDPGDAAALSAQISRYGQDG